MTAASEIVDEVRDDLSGMNEELEERLEDMRERVGELDLNVRRVVREHPFACVAGAVAAGYLLGRIFTRR